LEIEGESQKFIWLIEKLIPINEKIKGCEIKFPDTVIFHRGKPRCIIKTDKDGCLITNKNANKMTLHQIRNDFFSIVRKRRKEGDTSNTSKIRMSPTRVRFKIITIYT